MRSILNIIRHMTDADISDVQKIAQMSWNDTYEGIIPITIQTNFLQAAYSKEQLQKRINHTHFYVAEVNSDIVGFANFSPVQKGVSELIAIYLHPSYQGKGIGTLLLDNGIQSLDMKKVIVHVEKENEIGLQFYKTKGFNIVSESTEEFSGHKLQTVKMVLTKLS